MEYHELGKAGFRVSSLSFGASALGGVFGSVDEEDGIRAVHEAVEAGINYFDVAPAYGATKAETVLGKALRGIPRGKYFLSTKAGKYAKAGGGDELDYSERRIRDGLEESLNRLGVDFVDLVHLHDFEYFGRSMTDRAFAEGFPTLAALKAEGRIGAVGAGIYPMDLWERVVSEAPVDAILLHNHYCLNDTRGLELVAGCSQRNIGIINASPFASGLLTGGPVAGWHPADAGDRALFAEAARLCEERGSSIAKLAFQFASQNHPFQTTMFSTARTASLRRNLGWFAEPVDQELVAAVREVLRPVIDKQWDYDEGLRRLAAGTGHA